MTTPITLRIRQEGYVRANGYQAAQWAVTVPVEDPPGSTPLATDPLSYKELFVVDQTGPRDVLRRIATLQDYVALSVAELSWFDIRTPGAAGKAWFDSFNIGDTLRVSGAPHWIQSQAPYTTYDFVVDHAEYRASGSAPVTAVGKQLTLPGYTFTPEDVGRWVELTGFTTTAYNGMTQIVSYDGSVAVVDKTFGTNETGSAWRFPWFHVQTTFSGQEPRYFPSREENLAWALVRSSSVVCFADSGLATRRSLSLPLVRSVRFTELAPTLGAATDLFEYTAASMARLQAEGARADTEFNTIITRTVGP